jgi:hypothetical protein
MTIAVKILNDQIREISESNTLLDMLMEFEKTLDNLNLYAYQNWIDGEVLQGPVLGRHFMTVKLLYPHKKMPDPEGAKRLLSRGCLVKYGKDTLLKPRKVRNFDDLQVQIKPDGSTRYKTKTDSSPVWVVEIQMPRHYVDKFDDSFISELNADQEPEQATDQAPPAEEMSPDQAPPAEEMSPNMGGLI